MVTSVYIEFLEHQHRLVANWLGYYQECRMKGYKHNKLNTNQLIDDAKNGIAHRAKVVNYLLELEREIESAKVSQTIFKTQNNENY